MQGLWEEVTLRGRGSFDDTIVIVVSDHGEEFKEHGAIGHGKNLHNVSLRVPLIVAAPGLRPGVVRAGAGLVDIMPTVLEMLGVEGPPVQGQSLLAEMLVPNPEPAPRPLFSESERRGRWNSVFYGDHHLILQRRNKTYRLYDWVADPSEQSPLEFHSSQVGQTLAEYLRAHMANTARGAPGSAPAPSPEEIEMLKKMRYIEE